MDQVMLKKCVFFLGFGCLVLTVFSSEFVVLCMFKELKDLE